jgi:hypothetical protein
MVHRIFFISVSHELKFHHERRRCRWTSNYYHLGFWCMCGRNLVAHAVARDARRLRRGAPRARAAIGAYVLVAVAARQDVIAGSAVQLVVTYTKK